MAVRLGLAALAIVVLAWLALSLRGLGLSERGERLTATPDATPAQVEEAEQALEDARFLNPDTRPLLAEGALLSARGGRRAREGVALIERAVRREPDNVVAWGVLAAATRELDPERSRQARARQRELSPPVESE
jgi:predicted Zn-dependent protease